MVMRRLPPRLRARKGRAAERGATLFVVVLVMTLLMGIGAFAARSAHLATASSGYARHQAQARYLSEYGLLMATTLVGGSGGQSYLRLMGNPGDTCTGQAGMQQPSCYKMFYRDLQAMVGGASFSLCETSSTTYPGSLGMANAECDFALELTDKTQGMTPNGFDTSNGAAKPLKFFYITATTTAQVRLISSTTAALDARSAESSGTQTLRSRILAGPYPGE